MLGFGPIGTLAVATGPSSGAVTFTLTAAAGSFAMTGVAATFTIREATAAGSFALSGISASFTLKEAAGAGAFAYTGVAASFTIREQPTAGVYTLNGVPANETVLEADQAGAFVFTGNPATLTRTGFDYEFQQGGIGHLLLEAEEAKRLAAITNRPPPGFLDTRTPPTAAPIGPPIAPAAPAVDLGALRAHADALAAQKAAKQRRDIEAILLLAA